jgi:endonuclease/exonuclease/phosphatase family metal-dependent hydrolase
MHAAQRGPRSGTSIPALILLAAVVVLSSCSGGGSKPPPKPPLAGTVLEWNLSGFSQHRGAPAPVDALMRQVQAMSPPPVAIVLVELCSSQYDLLRDRLSAAPLSYRSANAWSIPAFGQPSCASYGNAVFWQGDAEPNGVQPLTYPDDVQAGGARTQEKRNLLCVAFRSPETATAASTPLRVCGTHLDRLPSFAAKQFGVARGRVEQFNATGPPTVLTGDLNLPPSSPAFDAWYRGGYTEADLTERTRARPTTRSSAKFDYAFVPTATARVPQTADIIFVPESDHAMYVAHVAVNG